MTGKYRWVVIALLFFGGMINYLDRSALSVAAPLMTKDLGLDPAALGIVFSAFFFGYAPFCFVGGWAADRYGARRVFIVAMTVWSIFCGLTAAATSVITLLIIRLVFGMGEAPFSTGANKVVSNWFPRREQAGAIGMANAGTPLGGAISGPIVGLIAVAFGWRVSFLVVAAFGLVWVVAWAVLVRDRPADHPRVSREEVALIESDPGGGAIATAAALPLGTYLKRGAVLSTGFAFFGYAYLLYFFLSWFPSYLTMAQHLSVQHMSVVTVIPWLLGFIGLGLGGFVCDALYRWTGNALLARKIVLVGCLLAAAVCVALAGTVTGVAPAVALMAGSVFFLYLTGNTYWAIVLDTVEPARVGGVGGFVHFIANCAGIISPALTGFLVQTTGAFTSAFVLAGAFALFGAGSVAFFVRAPAMPVRAVGRAAAS